MLDGNVFQWDSLLGCVHESADGTTFLDFGMESYQTDSWSLISLIALLLYILFALIGVILLIIKLIARIAKKRGRYVGMGWMTPAQIMRVVSFAAVIAALCDFGVQSGITQTKCYILCGVESVCLLSFIFAAVSSLRGMITKSPEKAGGIRYFINFMANGISVFAVIALELIRFGGI